MIKNPSPTTSSYNEETLKAKDWKYIAEGGEHAIFAYRPHESIYKVESFFVGKILRIRKADICTAHLYEKHNMYKDSSPEIKLPMHQMNFQLSFIYSVMKPYIDLPKDIKLSCDFVHRLYMNTMKEHNGKHIIPSSRQKDWFIDHDEKNKNNFAAMHWIRATMQENYRSLNNVSPSLSIEIKPKAGYMPHSPLIHPKNRAKYFHSRFEILQQLYERNIIDKGWSSIAGDRVVSRYDPLDLFANDIDRMNTALKSLFDCPQNNLKVFWCNEIVYGTMVNDVNKIDADLNESKRDLLKKVFQHEEAIENTSEQVDQCLQTKLRDLISIILYQYDGQFLRSLLAIQRNLDVLDYDGVIIIYKKLVSLCNGSKEDAEKLVEKMDRVFPEEDIPNLLLNKNLLDLYTNLYRGQERICSYLRICQEVLDFTSENLVKSKAVSDVSTVMDQWYERALKCVESFDKNECITLLQNWLISLMACDVSFIITVCPSTGTESNNQKVQVHDQMFDIGIKLVDIDGKPAKKLRNRQKIESKIHLFH